MSARRTIALTLLILAAVLLWTLAPDAAVLLEARDALKAQADANPWSAPPIFLIVYLAGALTALPVAAVMAIAAGALFGRVEGFALAMSCGTISAVAAMLVARHLFRDWLAGRLNSRLPAIDAGVARDGPITVASLRLLPVMPFFALNLAVGLTRMRPLVFAAASAVGMAPAAAIYVDAGARATKFTKPSDALSPGLIAGLVVLALLPIVARGLLRRRALARPQK